MEKWDSICIRVETKHTADEVVEAIIDIEHHKKIRYYDRNTAIETKEKRELKNKSFWMLKILEAGDTDSLFNLI